MIISSSQDSVLKTQETDDLIQKYLNGFMRTRNASEDTIRSHRSSLRNFFAYVKAGEEQYKEADGLHELEFVYVDEPSTDEPIKTAEQVTEMSRRELIEFLRENPYNAIDAEKCIEAEKKGKNRSTILKYLKQKSNSEPKIDYVEVTREDVESVTRDDIRDFIVYLRDEKENSEGKKGVKKGTFIKYRSAINTFYNEWIAVEDYLDWNGNTVDFGKGKLKEATSNWENEGGRTASRKLKISQIEKMLNEASGIEKTILLTFLKTGMRTKELARLKVNRLNLKNQFFYLNKRKCTQEDKKYKKENVIFDKELKHELESHLRSRVLDHDEDFTDLSKHSDEYLFSHDGGGYSRGSILKMMKKVAKDAGLQNQKNKSKFGGCHDFRHTFAHLYEHRIRGTEIGRRGYKKVQMSHELTQNEEYTLERGATGMDAEIPDERREDYNRAMPKLLN